MSIMISAKEWNRIQFHFNELCDLQPDQQQTILATLNLESRLRNELVRLLAVDSSDRALERMAINVHQIAESLRSHGLVGETVGAYRIVRRLGAGGMGEVYLAERCDGQFDVQVAIKFLSSPGVRKRELFKREQQALARLSHPGIARIFDAGEHPRLGAYLVMEYVEGEPINKAALRPGVSWRSVLSWLADAAEAVAYAHQNMVLHRDLKPDHVCITPEGSLKILDFGVAGLLSEEADSNTVTQQAGFTPRYAAPEQILFQPATTRTDVYALGVILYELMTDGLNPFGENIDRMTELKLKDFRQPLPRQTPLGSSRRRDLDAIIFRSLAREPEARYGSTDELAADLRRLLDNQAVSARTPGLMEFIWRWANRHPLSSVTLFLCTCMVLTSIGIVIEYAHKAETERDIAVQEADQSRAASKSLAGLIAHFAFVQQYDSQYFSRDLLAIGQASLESELNSAPEARSYIELVLAQSLLNLERYADAMALVATEPVTSSQWVRIERDLLRARLYWLNGNPGAMLAYLNGLDVSKMTFKDRARLENLRATGLIILGDTEAATASAIRAKHMADRSEEGFEAFVEAENLLAVIASNKGDYAVAQTKLEALLELTHTRLGYRNMASVEVMHNLAQLAYKRDDLELSYYYYSQVAELSEELFGVMSRHYFLAKQGLFRVYWDLGDAEAAEAVLVRLLSTIEAVSGTEAPAWQSTADQLRQLHMTLGRESGLTCAPQEAGPFSVVKHFFDQCRMH